jgi:hypothetical protein
VFDGPERAFFMSNIGWKSKNLRTMKTKPVKSGRQIYTPLGFLGTLRLRRASINDLDASYQVF